jgi:DNA repair protein RadB
MIYIVLVSFKKEARLYKFMERLSSGSRVMDVLLDGGFEKDIITTIYGPAGSGKTCTCILASIEVVKAGKKVIFLDTEGGFSVERLKQISPEYEKILENMLFFRPVTFDEQKDVFEKLKNLINDRIGLIVVDTISSLYRAEYGKNSDIYRINKELGLQLSYLSEICRKKSIPIILTNQVYASFEEEGKVNMVGGDMMKYASKCLIELKNLKGSNRAAVLKKHRSIMNEKNVFFRIVDKGFELEER